MKARIENVRPAATRTAQLATLEEAVRKAERRYLDAGKALAAMRALFPTSDLFEVHACRAFGWSRSTLYRKIQATEIAESVRKFGPTPDTEDLALVLAQLAPEQRGPVWREACRTAAGSRATHAHLAACVEAVLGRPHDAAPGESSDAEAFAALPPQEQLAAIQRDERAAEDAAKKGAARATGTTGGSSPTRPVSGLDRADRERDGQIERLTERLRRIHAGKPEVADEADVALALYAAVVRGEDWAVGLARKISDAGAQMDN